MAEMDVGGLRVLLEVAESGSFTVAGRRLGYTQSAVSRQIARLEAAVGQPLFDRHRTGVRLTPTGARLAARARQLVTDLDAALADARQVATGRVRVGAFPATLATTVADALALLRDIAPEVVVTVREATTPALARGLRAGTIDLALVAQSPPFRPIDAESPGLEITPLAERDLLLAVGPRHPFRSRQVVEVDELRGQVWVASPGDGDPLLGVWPGLDERPDVRAVARDWWAKLRLVEAGLGVTTITSGVAGHLPPGVTAVAVRGEPAETRRLGIARLPGHSRPEVDAFIDAVRQVTDARPTGADDLPT